MAEIDKTNKSKGGNPAWVPGIPSPNPEGRPKGARNKFGEAFVLDFAEDWAKNGKDALEQLRGKSIEGYVRVGCAILPKMIEFDDETKDILAKVAGASIDFKKIREKLESER